MATSAAAGLLGRQLKQMQTDKDIPGISCGLVDNNVMEWEVMLMISDDCRFYGGNVLEGLGMFPSQEPQLTIVLSILLAKSASQVPLRPLHFSVMHLTNVTEVLHPPEEDKYGYESAAERWSPVQTPETILLSVISMLSSPNDESPANVEAARLWREDTREFKKRCRANVRASLGEE
ncbi:MAG: hypothetical protein Q9191_004991 [Dirinaria sp. TL-2023a]